MTERAATPPCLLKGLVQYTPRSDSFQEASNCSHDYVTSDSRSILPELDERAVAGTVWRMHSTCRECRMHLVVSLEFDDALQPCPNLDYPLHHFLMITTRLDDPRSQAFEFRCGAPKCRAKLITELHAPVLSNQEVQFLVSPAALQRRADQTSFRREAEVSPANAFEALGVFKSYTRDALAQADANLKRVPDANKKFSLALGAEAGPLLKRLGFVYEMPTEDGAWGHWRLPLLSSAEHSEPRVMLENLSDELLSLMQRRPDSERVSAKEHLTAPVRSSRDLDRLMGSLDYNKCPAHLAVPPNDLTNSFDILGAVADFDDQLIIFAYDRNVIWDPTRIEVFLDALRRVTTFRQTEALQTKVAMDESTAPPSQAEVSVAYQYFDIHPDRGAMIPEEQLLGKFHTMLSDLGPDARQSARSKLSIIARARGSHSLENAANQRLETYEDALTFLGADETTADEFVIALATAKQSEARDNQQMVQQAVSIIADNRNSDALRFHALRDSGKSSMSLSEARALLGISDTDNPDDDSISVCHGVAVSENAHRASEYNDALSVIAEHRNSDALRKYLNDSKAQFQQTAVVKTSLPTDPRGLRNIGNTCYLNSLLQYLYTIRPLREMLKNFDDYRETLDDNAPFVKKINGENARMADVKTSFDFVHELSSFFKTLEETNEVVVAPAVNLARLTIGQPKANGPSSPVTARRNTVTNSRPSAAPSVPSTMLDGAAASKKIAGNNDLIDLSDNTEPSTSNSSNAVQPVDSNKPIPVQDSMSSDVMIEATEAVPMTNRIQGQAAPDTHSSAAPSANKPLQDMVRETEEYSKQQDIGDALENVVKQLQLAIKAESVSKSGDQVDLISRLIWGVRCEIQVRKGVESSTALFDFKDALVGVYQGPTDLNDALSNDFFGVDKHGDLEIYSTAEKLPPVLHMTVGRAVELPDGKYVRTANRLRLHKTIYMDRFMNNEEMKQRRMKEFQHKEAMNQLKASHNLLESTSLGISTSNVLRSADTYLKALAEHGEALDLDIGQEAADFNDVLESEAIEAEKRAAEVLKTMQPLQEKLDALYPSQGSIKYCLQAVFVHIGSSTLNSGHWFILMYDHRNDVWRKYNDERVDVVEPSEVESTVFCPVEGSREASAFLSYVRKEERDAIFETVVRNPEPQQTLMQLDDPVQIEQVGQQKWQNTSWPSDKTARPSWDTENRANDHLNRW